MNPPPKKSNIKPEIDSFQRQHLLFSGRSPQKISCRLCSNSGMQQTQHHHHSLMLLLAAFFVVCILLCFQTKVFTKKNEHIPSSPHPYTPHCFFTWVRDEIWYVAKGHREVSAPMCFARGGHLGQTLLSVSFRVGPYRFCSDGNPTNFSMLLLRSYLILSNTHVLDFLKVLLNM